MRSLLIIFALAVAAFAAWMIFGKYDPVTTAQLKCEFAIERSTGYDIGIMEVSRAIVSGDVFNGTVVMPFDIGGQRRDGLCIFKDGNIWTVMLDGKLLAGRRP